MKTLVPLLWILLLAGCRDSGIPTDGPSDLGVDRVRSEARADSPRPCMSPVPNLPWKLDWAQPGNDRSHSLVIYSLLEREPSNIEWKEVPGRYSGTESTVRSSGPELLYAYWFGRYFGSITPSM